MRCTQVAQHLNESGALDVPAIQEHIRQCAACQTAWESERMLRQDFAAVRADSPQLPSLKTAITRLDRALIEEKERPVKSILRHPFTTRPRRWGFSLAAATLVLAFLVLVPFSYEHTVGTQLVLTSSDPTLAQVDTGALNSLLEQKGFSGATVKSAGSVNGSSLTYFVRGSQTDAMSAFKATCTLLPALQAEPGVRVKPWRVRESGSLLAQIGARTFSVSVTTTGKTEAEIADEVREQLAAQGMQVDGVWITKDDANGTVSMTLQGQVDGSNGEDAKFEIELEETVTGYGLSNDQLSTSVFIDDIDPNMSDNEIKAKIEQRLASQGVSNATVTVTNGEISIDVEEEVER